MDISISIVTGYWLEDRVRFQAETGNFRHHVQSGTAPAQPKLSVFHKTAEQ
jgi:hypothetical protein